MQVRIERRWPKLSYTIGRVYIDGEFFCNSLEDRDRGLYQGMLVEDIARIKVVGETAIPKGRYKVAITYSPKYGREMPQVMCVPGYTGVRIHSGNTAADTEGCILLGKNDKPGWISQSRDTCKRFEELLKAAGGTCELEIV